MLRSVYTNTRVNLLFKKDTKQVAVVLSVMDSAGDFFDSDYFMGETNVQGFRGVDEASAE